MVCALLVIVLSSTGCYSEFDLGDVQGLVTVDGKPKAGVILSFKQREGVRPSGGTSDADGNYRLVFNRENAGALVGINQVSVLAEDNLAKKLGHPQSTLLVKEVEVKRGSNTIDLELTEFRPADQ